VKPCNFPARKLRRQLRAKPPYIADGDQALLDAARARRSKIHRTHKKGSAS
jgi:hypothetical protein